MFWTLFSIIVVCFWYISPLCFPNLSRLMVTLSLEQIQWGGVTVVTIIIISTSVVTTTRTYYTYACVNLLQLSLFASTAATWDLSQQKLCSRKMKRLWLLDDNVGFLNDVTKWLHCGFHFDYQAQKRLWQFLLNKYLLLFMLTAR